jgi:cytochrome c biogenesis protein CcdA
VFLVVVGSSVAVEGIGAGLIQFVSYALGMGVVLVVLTIGIALFQDAAVGPFRAVVPKIQKISAVLVLLMGSYLVYYWLIKGELLETFT